MLKLLKRFFKKICRKHRKKPAIILSYWNDKQGCHVYNPKTGKYETLGGEKDV